MTIDEVPVALAEFKGSLARVFGERMLQLVLFGSHARGLVHEDSDVDILVLLKSHEPGDGHRAVDAAVEIMLRRPNVVLSPLVMTEEELDHLRARERRLARDIDREGILV